MASSLTHTQVRTNPSDGVYVVVDTVGSSVVIPREVFVYATLGTLVFDHVATVLDIQTYPNSQAAAVAGNLPFYRLATVTQTFSNVDVAEDFATMLVQRMSTVAREYDLVVNTFVGTDTNVVLPPP